MRRTAALCALVLAGCSGGSDSGTPASGGAPADGGALSISDLVAVESSTNVLAFNVSWTTSQAADTKLHVDCDGLEPWTLSSPKDSTAHHVFLMGLATGVSCTLTATSSAGKATASAKTPLQVGQLPGYLPRVEVTEPAAAGSVAPGWTLIDLSNLHAKIPYIVALVDPQGHFRWYFQFPTSTAGADSPVLPYKEGVVLGGDFLPMAYVTWRGKVVWKGPTDGNHEVRPAETPDDFYYISPRPCDTMTQRTSTILEYRPADDSVVWSWKLCDYYTPPQDVYDWAHMNTVALFPDHKYLIASARNQNSIFKIDRATGKITWVMGYHGEVEDGFHGDFTIADADRFYHQHDTTILPNGHILMFDNGRQGVREWSRALELAYSYDPSGTSEAHAVWQFRHKPDIFDRIWGSAQRFDNGNTLVCFGSVDAGIRTTITEASSSSEPVWEIRMPEYWGVYRAYRMKNPPRGSVVD